MNAAVAFCRHLRMREVPMTPLLLAIGSDQVGELQLRDDLFDDFCVDPGPARGAGGPPGSTCSGAPAQSLRPDIIEHGP